MLAYFETSIGWGELLKRTWNEIQRDDGLSLAAQLAYYFFLALFPALLFLIALAGTLANPELISRLVDMMSGAVPPDVINIIRDQLIRIAQGDQGGIMTFGVLAALWSSSSALVSLSDALNRAYGVEDSRGWMKRRLIAIVLTIGVAAFIIISVALVLVGPQAADWLAARLGLSEVFTWAWRILQWPLVFVLVVLAIGLIYYFAPDVEQDFVFLTPGSVLAAILWLLASLGFRFYVVNFGSYNETYGAIGGVMVLLLWLYISGLVVIVGAEMNAEIEHASAHGKAPGEKRPGERKVIGARAAREFLARQESPGRHAVPVPRRRWTTTAFARTGVLIGGIVAAFWGRRVGS